jgi:two-component system sensor histidine kinase MprB
VAVASLSAYVAVRANLRGDVDDSLRERVTAEGVRSLLFPHFDDRGPGGEPGRPFGGPPRAGEPTVYAQLAYEDGSARLPPQGGIELGVDARARRVAAGEAGTYLSDQEVQGTHLRVLTAQVGTGVAVQLARPLDEIDSLLGGLRVALIAVSGVGILMGAGLGWLISGRALRPVRAFTERTEAIAGAPDPSARLEGGRDDELGRLAQSFNTTLDTLERSVDAQRQLVADASHELRTPLASLKTNIEVLQSGDSLAPADRAELLQDMVTQADELTALVGDVVDVARRRESEAGFQEVNLHELAADVAARSRRLSPRSYIVEELSPWVVRGDPERLTRLVTNLVDNAIKWSPPGGRVEMRLTDGELTVRDHGAGIDADDLPHVFDRFYRATSARSLPGSGLGLAIVRQVAEAHGAEVAAENAPDGGALFRVRFPAAE